ncbi:hypothetical protein, partial [Listeria booriae]|uniref:hypothetical protein n=1 Tax=Listeria booriae TaxID=1552123 RepID=UPI001C8BACE0
DHVFSLTYHSHPFRFLFIVPKKKNGINNEPRIHYLHSLFYTPEFDESNPDYVEIAGKEKSLN